MDEIKAIRKAGHDVRELTPYQFRINHVLDLYPKRRKFHNIKTQERGHFPTDAKRLLAFIEKQSAGVKDEQPKSGRYLTPAMEAQAGWWTKLGSQK